MTAARPKNTQKPEEALPLFVNGLKHVSIKDRPAIVKSIIAEIKSADATIPNLAQILSNHLREQELVAVIQVLIEKNMHNEVADLMANYQDLTPSLIASVLKLALKKGQAIQSANDEEKFKKSSEALAAAQNDNDRYLKTIADLQAENEKLETSKSELKRSFDDEQARVKRLQDLHRVAENEATKAEEKQRAVLEVERKQSRSVKEQLEDVRKTLQLTQNNNEALAMVSADLVNVNRELSAEARRKQIEIDNIKGGVILKGSFGVAGAVGGAILGFILFPPFGAIAGAAIGAFVGVIAGAVVNKFINWMRTPKVTQPRVTTPVQAPVVAQAPQPPAPASRLMGLVSQSIPASPSRERTPTPPRSSTPESSSDTEKVASQNDVVNPDVVQGLNANSFLAHKDQPVKPNDDSLENLNGITGGFKAVKGGV